jgi:hypothetical protein
MIKKHLNSDQQTKPLAFTKSFMGINYKDAKDILDCVRNELLLHGRKDSSFFDALPQQ